MSCIALRRSQPVRFEQVEMRRRTLSGDVCVSVRPAEGVRMSRAARPAYIPFASVEVMRSTSSQRIMKYVIASDPRSLDDRRQARPQAKHVFFDITQRHSDAVRDELLRVALSHSFLKPSGTELTCS